MKRLLALTVAIGALIVAPSAWAGPVVQIMPNGFVPNTVTIPSDDSITWTNKDSVARQVVADAGAFKSSVLKPGESYTYDFPAAGAYSYHGQFKPTQRGAVNVRRVESRSVTIGVSKRVVTAGQTIELAGSVSNGEGGQEVRVLMTPYRGIQTAKTVVTDADGTWSLRVKPAIRTEYYVEFGALISAPLRSCTSARSSRFAGATVASSPQPRRARSSLASSSICSGGSETSGGRSRSSARGETA